ncbi:hypothetical protein C2G38_2108281 [Gigaspora rosea]|uniref:C2H2-type domain-containing protein n=1 Tax=Gigaspora rosea TaxID=44941 RepID=A0A397UH08_9GLOM|nr:hypothetical protein C2G38_2108281 [Gigaspora rosea]
MSVISLFLQVISLSDSLPAMSLFLDNMLIISLFLDNSLQIILLLLDNNPQVMLFFGQLTASHIIVPRHPPVIGHKKKGHKRIIYHKCIICKRECKSPKLLKEHNMIYHNLT